jgi:type III secretory pathway component EscV
MLPGDVLLVASFISYLGCFTKQYRLELFERKWLPFLKKLQKPIPLSLGANVLSLLSDDALVTNLRLLIRVTNAFVKKSPKVSISYKPISIFCHLVIMLLQTFRLKKYLVVTNLMEQPK